MGDPERYRVADEVKKWQENDPIGIYRKYLSDQKIADDKELDQIDQKCAEEVADAVKFAKASPEPDPESLFAHIYVDEL